MNDPELARTLYAEPPTLANLAGQFNFVAGQLSGSVRIASVQPKANRALVLIDWDKPKGPGRQVAIVLEHRYGQWKIVSARFLDLLVQQLQDNAASPPQS